MPFNEVERRALAPTGVLRATINLGNPILATTEQGVPQGVSVDLARALADQLELPLQLQMFDGAGKAVKAVAAGQADFGFFAIDPQRAEGVRFTPPYLIIEGAYLVREQSHITSMDQVDSACHRVVVGQGSAYDLFLSRTLQAARIVRAPTSPAVVDLFLSQPLDVAAGVRQQLQADAHRIAGLRLLPGHFMVIEQAMALPVSRDGSAHPLLARFLEHAKRQGLLQSALQRHGITGVSVAD